MDAVESAGLRVDDLVGVSDADRPRLVKKLNELVQWRDDALYAVRGAVDALFDKKYAGPSDIRLAAATVSRLCTRAEQREKEVTDFLLNPRTG